MSRILVIDGEPATCAVVARVASAAGYAVMVATDASAGIEAARQHSFAAAIVDLCIPEVGGFEAIRALRARAPDMRMIALSELAAESPGAPDFLGMTSDLQGVARLGKPIRPEALLDLLPRQSAT
jgi:CheY-like chemotaxis protein